ncbi:MULTISPECIES: diadenylate cyclase CdaA [Galbibacter]|uniref:Diadenylate cyclase n=1 Tax=Galbibacter pacificus TaxID=2996052 RepID=A0ABT6FVM5_9FLAO|nr:diadenylate cyclase CdaA [Galbibacter pacificus]MDG3583767.1 diadenylate cyclase CdaA [Galbibacter pacificus]MDG3587315.1 diadenylate cyclase CdaA [Galbibacter pacificus]
MELFDFVELKIVDIIDIFLVAFLFYYLYKLVKGTVAINIFIGIVVIYVIYLLTEALNMRILSNIFGKFIGAGFFALLVVFQQEIRKFLLMVGSTNFTSKKGFLKHFNFLKHDGIGIDTNIDAILAACEKMSIIHTGALIVIERNTSLDFVKHTGDTMNIEINQPIIESIFYKNSTLHDGAVIIEGNKIVATRAILPVSNERTIPLRFGLRHRAAIGVTEKTDAVALVVSEENGQISYMKNGEFVLYNELSDLKNMIIKDLS